MCESVAVCLPIEELSVLRSINKAEHPEICLQSDDIDTNGAHNESKVLKYMDCFVYQNILNLHSIYISSSFMNPKTEL